MKPSYGVIVGRFQVNDLHDGHMELFRQVRSRHKTVVVFIGVHPTMFEAAAREFREECCATLGTVEILGFKEHFRYGMHYFMVYVHAGYYIGKIKNGIPKISGPWQWRDIKKVCNTSLLTKCTEPFDMLQKALMLSSTKARAIC